MDFQSFLQACILFIHIVSVIIGIGGHILLFYTNLFIKNQSLALPCWIEFQIKIEKSLLIPSYFAAGITGFILVWMNKLSLLQFWLLASAILLSVSVLIQTFYYYPLLRQVCELKEPTNKNLKLQLFKLNIVLGAISLCILALMLFKP